MTKLFKFYPFKANDIWDLNPRTPSRPGDTIRVIKKKFKK